MQARPHVHSPACFRVFRDGKWLPTRECRHVIAAEAVAEHQRINARRRLYLGEKRK